jgi:hypothetical protein
MRVAGPLLVWTMLAGCAADIPVGVAYVRLTEMPGRCGVVDPVGASPYEVEDFLEQLTNRPYRRVRATAAFQGGSLLADGHNIAIAWRDTDGQIGRFFVDVGTNRGYGNTLLPNVGSLSYEQATGFVQWQGGERAFAGLEARGYIAYVRDSDTDGPGELFGIVAFDGVGVANEALCRIVAVHATTGHDRFEAYDPSWLAPEPGVMIVERTPPTFVGERSPTDRPVMPEAASADPGGLPPPLMQRSPSVFSNGASGGGACD